MPDDAQRLAPGKLPAALLASLLPGTRDPRVLQGPGIGRDAAVVSVGDRLLVLTSDPITFAAGALAHYAVTVNANDIAVVGATPRWLLATVLLPAGRAAASDAERLLRDLDSECRKLGVELVGGHTEITAAVDRSVVVGTMVGEVTRERFVASDGAIAGDVLLCTRGVPIEGLALLGREAGEALLRAGVPGTLVARARGLLQDPGISVVASARHVCDAGRVHAMHDPTEGGLATALHELADAAGVGLCIEAEAIPWLPEAAPICEALGLDAWGLIASGALLVALPPEEESQVAAALDRAGIPQVRIGHCVAASEGRLLREASGALRPLPRFDADEITRAL